MTRRPAAPRAAGLGLLCLLAAGGCAGLRPLPLEKTAYLSRAETRSDPDLSVAVSVLTDVEGHKVLGAPLAAHGLQAVWLRIKNRSGKPFVFLQRYVTPEYYSAGEAAFVARSRYFKGGLVSRAVSLLLLPVNGWRIGRRNAALDANFRKLAIGNLLLSPGEEAAGFVYVPLDKGIKKVPVVLLGPAGAKKMLFTIDVPGIMQDYKRADFEGRYRPEEHVAVGFEDLRAHAEALPCCTTNRLGLRDGDPINLVLIGGLRDILTAFKLAGWDETEGLSFKTGLKLAGAYFDDTEYRYAPVSSLYFQGRRHDVAIQKARRNVNERLHLRLWYTQMRVDGKPVWVGQVSRDVGIRWTRTTWNFMTHRIEADLDESREYVMADLMSVGRLGSFGYARGVGLAAPGAPKRNLSGDPYHTDGARLVAEVTAEDSAPDFRDWGFYSE
jgi:hypothetical protein